MRRDIQKNITSACLEQNSFTKHTSIDGCKNPIKTESHLAFVFFSGRNERVFQCLLTFVVMQMFHSISNVCEFWCGRFCITVIWTNVVDGRFIAIGLRQGFAEVIYSKSACFQYVCTVQSNLITLLKNCTCNNKCSAYR